VLTLVASIGASAFAVGLTALRLWPLAAARWAVRGFIGLFRNTPLLVQLLVWYFVGFGLLPANMKRWLTDDHPWAALPGNVSLLAPEFLASAFGLTVFIGVFLSEEIQAGLNAVPAGQREAAASQGLSPWTTLGSVLLPQALRNARQPIVGQYLNLMKLTSIACSVGLAEITYQARVIESYSSHAFEAFAAGSILYLGIGFVLERLLLTGWRR
jgi:polar amino acid transport system permease protein